MTETPQENGRIEELRRKHSELWNEISVMNEDEAEHLLNSFSSQIKREHINKHSLKELSQELGLNDTVRSPWFYVSVIIGLCIPVLLYAAFIYISLLLE
ncbi:hypothetical protein MUG84_10370 [Paenibacillus sp. KQZ6P-2]|uniref:Uncharacterized protein n=1 Tax=Paenibacillus mangrovi TaxID=2931978 RepID=A0A9X1WR57_9BACL|nr:hypothetical protein [Paenibacillus mangrovi]MCJ8012148.1 hypothetical protein [Paenibacillus mangrovi]